MSAYSTKTRFPHALGPTKKYKQLLMTVWKQLKLAKLQLHKDTQVVQKMTADLQWQKRGAKVTHEVLLTRQKQGKMILTPDDTQWRDNTGGTRSEGDKMRQEDSIYAHSYLI
jgi:hypothetical protein